MSIWLRKRLGLWFGGSAALVFIASGALKIQAQQQRNMLLNTPEEAAQRFQRLLDSVAELSNGAGQIEFDGKFRWGLISSIDDRKFGEGGIDTLLKQLAENSKKPTYATKNKRQENGATVIDIAPDVSPQPLPVVLVQEENRWRVNLVATYAKRLGLGEGELQSDIFERTGIALAGLPNSDSPEVRQRICQTNLKEIGLALLMYSQDYDEFFPQKEKWMEDDGLKPYVRSEKVFHCPATKNGKFGYAFNANLALKSYVNMNDQRRTVAVYETSDWKPNAFGTGENLEFRHDVNYLGEPNVKTMMNVALADGSVRSYLANKKMDFSLNPAPIQNP